MSLPDQDYDPGKGRDPKPADIIRIFIAKPSKAHDSISNTPIFLMSDPDSSTAADTHRGMLSALWRRLEDTVHRFGVLNGGLYLLDRIFTRLFGGRIRIIRYLLVAQPVPPEAAGAPVSIVAGRSRIRPVLPGDPVERAFPRPTDVIAMRQSTGATCIVAEVSERFAGFIWLTRNQYEEDEVRCTYVLAEPAVSAWDYDVYVAPDFRLGRTLSRLWGAANAHLASGGVRWSFSRISRFNPDSIAAHARLGIRTVGHATFLRLGQAQLMLADCPPYVHLSLGTTSRPRLRLAPPEHI